MEDLLSRCGPFEGPSSYHRLCRWSLISFFTSGRTIIPRFCPVLLLVFSASFCDRNVDTDRILVSGTVEVETVKIAPLMAGRITELNIEEGGPVAKDEVVARIDCAELELRLKQAEAVHKAAAAAYKLVRKGARDEDVANVRELVNQAEIAEQSAARDLDWAKSLLESKSIPRKQYDDLTARRDLAAAQLSAVKQQYAKVLAGARPEEVETVLAAVDQAKAAMDIVREGITRCEVKAPASGTILYKYAAAGEVAAPGAALGVVADLSKVKVKGFVMEADLGFVKLGGPVSVFIDSRPGKPISAKVTRVSTEAEFTPKNVQTRDERVKTMYRIEVSVENPDGALKAGMPADIEIKKQ